jgi:serine/threonine protein kinase
VDSPQKSCTNCNRPVPIGVESDLCEICSATSQTADTHTSPPPEFDSQTGSGSIHLSDLPLPPGGSRSTTGFPLPTGDPPSDPVLIQPNPPGYELLGEISRGGMGVVYLARSLARKDLFVAAKFLLDPTNLSTFRRFQEEVKASPLQSDHVVKVAGGDTAANPPYFLMEVCGGGTLARRVKDGGPLDPKLAARWMKAIAAAVAEVHDRHVIHRDIKPGNILLARRDGRDAEFVRLKGTPQRDEPPFDPDDYVPKLSDFGLAKNLDTSHGLTVGSVAMGTPPYMPPEQINNPQSGEADERVGIRSDVYSLGATLYHLVCGRPPFEGTTAGVISAVLNDDPVRPRLAQKACPPELEAIIVKAMAKKPQNRYQTAKELADELDRFEKKPETVQAPRLTPLRRAWRAVCRRRKAMAALALVAGMFAAGAVWAAKPPVTANGQTEPKPDYEQAIKNNLAEKKRTVLVQETGVPKYFRTVIGPCIVEKSSGLEETCAIYPLNQYALLELCPEHECDHYTINAEIRYLKPHRAANEDVPVADYAGIYFGYAGRQSGGSVGHQTFAVTFKDHHISIPRTGKRVWEHANFQRLVFKQEADRIEGPASEMNGASGEYEVSRTLPGQWRAIRIEVSRKFIKAWWFPEGKNSPEIEAKPFLTWTAAEINARFEQTRKTAEQMMPGVGVAMPDWSPRMPFGILAAGTSVGCRNVVITPVLPSN